MVKEYTCGRCGYVSRIAIDMERHLNRKFPCVSVDPRTGAVSQEQLLADFRARKRPYMVTHPQPATVINNTSNSNCHNTTNTNVVINVYRTPFGKEKVEMYIGQEEMRRIVEMPVERALRRYVCLRNFNKLYPACMNVRTENLSLDMARKVTDDAKWVTTGNSNCVKTILHCAAERMHEFVAMMTDDEDWNLRPGMTVLSGGGPCVHPEIKKLVNAVYEVSTVKNEDLCNFAKEALKHVEYALADESLDHYPLGRTSEPLLSLNA